MFVLSDLSTKSLQQLNKYLEIKGISNLDIGCGLPLYNPSPNFLLSLQTILDQQEKVILFIADDSSLTVNNLNTIKKEFESRDNLIYFRNPRRLGQLKNTKFVRDFFLQAIPNVKFFFLGSDHDIWSKTFSSVLREALLNNPEAFLVFSDQITVRNLEASFLNSVLSAKSSHAISAWDAFPNFNELISVASYNSRNNTKNEIEMSSSTADNIPKERTWNIRNKLSLLTGELSAGTLIYGLERLELTQQIRFYESTLGPDRLFLIKCLSVGTIFRVPSIEWIRIKLIPHSRKRQISNLFPDSKIPAHIFLRFPDLHHALLLLRDPSLNLNYRLAVGLCLVFRPILIKFKKTKKNSIKLLRKLAHFQKLPSLP